MRVNITGSWDNGTYQNVIAWFINWFLMTRKQKSISSSNELSCRDHLELDQSIDPILRLESRSEQWPDSSLKPYLGMSIVKSAG